MSILSLPVLRYVQEIEGDMTGMLYLPSDNIAVRGDC